MRRENFLRIGVHHANAVVWEPVYRTRLIERFSRLRRAKLERVSRRANALELALEAALDRGVRSRFRRERVRDVGLPFQRRPQPVAFGFEPRDGDPSRFQLALQPIDLEIARLSQRRERGLARFQLPVELRDARALFVEPSRERLALLRRRRPSRRVRAHDWTFPSRFSPRGSAAFLSTLRVRRVLLLLVVVLLLLLLSRVDPGRARRRPQTLDLQLQRADRRLALLLRALERFRRAVAFDARGLQLGAQL